MSLGILISRFGDFVREQPLPAEPAPVTPYPEDLQHIREVTGHHLVLLALLARADGDEALTEQRVIVDHCLASTHKAGQAISAAEKQMFADYVRDYRPSRTQLDPALKRLAHDSHDHVAALIAAAKAVVDADGERRDAEVKFLAEIEDDLKRL